jgi:hypothetical protein
MNPVYTLLETSLVFLNFFENFRTAAEWKQSEPDVPRVDLLELGLIEMQDVIPGRTPRVRLSAPVRGVGEAYPIGLTEHHHIRPVVAADSIVETERRTDLFLDFLAVLVINWIRGMHAGQMVGSFNLAAGEMSDLVFRRAVIGPGKADPAVIWTTRIRALEIDVSIVRLVDVTRPQA